MHFIFGAEQMVAFFKSPRGLTTTPGVVDVLEKGFSAPTRLRHIVTRDTTGVYHIPLPGSAPVEPHNRFHHNNHKIHSTYMSGSSLADLGARFLANAEIELKSLDIREEWTNIEDFNVIVQKTLFRASVTAIFGPHLLRLNPRFVEDYWLWDQNVPSLFKGYPRWLIPGVYEARERLLDGIEKCHNYAEEHFDWEDEDIANTEWEEYFGSKLQRERIRSFKYVDDADDEWRHALDLGLLFGASSNILPITTWEIIDTITRPELLAKCRAEIVQTMDPSHQGPLGIQDTKLFTNPLILSVYSETMRLRQAGFLNRTANIDDYHVNGWKFPKGDRVIASIWHEHRDKSVWNEGPVNGVHHPVDEFWGERFLVYPNNPATGPRKPGTGTRARKDQKVEPNETSTDPVFTAEPVTGSFFPYGGGAIICPGRFFAKQEALLGFALFISMFDIGLDEKVKLQLDFNSYPFGVLRPKGKFPARMRRRKAV